jgi:hypothetical protein
MDHHCAIPDFDRYPVPEYLNAFDDLERRAVRGQLTLTQLRREVHALRERFTHGRPVALCNPCQRR